MGDGPGKSDRIESGFGLTRRSAILGSASLILASCGGEESSPSPTPAPPVTVPPPVPASGRILGISPTEREDGNFDEVVAAIKQASIGNVTISLAWDEIEIAPGVFAPDPNFAAIAAQFYPAQNLSLTVVLVGIDTTADRRPDDLRAMRWNDPALISRFRAMQAWVIGQFAGADIKAWSVGNEVDALLGQDSQAWSDWTEFFASVSGDVRAALPGVPVGSKATSQVIENPVSRQGYADLLRFADASMLTYYPAGADFDSSLLPRVSDDFDAMLNAFPNHPLRLLECGFASGTAIGGSEQVQADFVSAVFAAWDANIASVPQIDYFAVHDLSPQAAAFFRDYYGFGGERFIAWLASLGLRKFDGTAKAGWARFVAEAAARGFG